MGVTFTLPNLGLLAKSQIIADFLKFTDLLLLQAPVTITDLFDGSQSGPEASFPGYSRQLLANYAVSGGKSFSSATLSFASVTFSCTQTYASPQTIGAVALLANPGGTVGPQFVVVCAMPGGPQVISQPGDSILAQLTLTEQRAPGQP